MTAESSLACPPPPFFSPIEAAYVILAGLKAGNVPISEKHCLLLRIQHLLSELQFMLWSLSTYRDVML